MIDLKPIRMKMSAKKTTSVLQNDIGTTNAIQKSFYKNRIGSLNLFVLLLKKPKLNH